MAGQPRGEMADGVEFVPDQAATEAAVELPEPVSAAGDRAAPVVLEQLQKLQSDAAYEPS